jgi:IS30 family transposase
MNIKYKHLNGEERTLIQLSLERGYAMRAIARSLGRSPSSVSRELTRNEWCDPKSHIAHTGRPILAGGFRSVLAHQRVALNRSRGRNFFRLTADGYLWSQVQKLLGKRYSPEKIAVILPPMFPGDSSICARHETIYTAYYAMPRGKLRTERLVTLRQWCKTRWPRARGEGRFIEIPNMVSIHQRSLEMDERVAPSHWEGDLIKGRGNASAVGKLVEPTSLLVTLVKVEDGVNQQAAVEGFSRIINQIDTQRRLLMTYDQSHEISQHQKLSERTGVKCALQPPTALGSGVSTRTQTDY